VRLAASVSTTNPPIRALPAPPRSSGDFIGVYCADIVGRAPNIRCKSPQQSAVFAINVRKIPESLRDPDRSGQLIRQHQLVISFAAPLVVALAGDGLVPASPS
jgi:hypothetical protein